MSKNKRKKQRLKTALILLIVLFILAGLGGMMLVSHRNKVAKEQRKQAAIAALESIPEVTATPVATATPIPTATPTPSVTPVPTIIPAFDPENYQGVWYSTDGLTTINIYEISLDSVSFTYKRVNGKNRSLFVEADMTAEVAGNATQFYLKDSDGNKAKGEFVFDKSGELYVKVKTYKRADGSKTYPKTESIMTREAPAEDTSAEDTPAAEQESSNEGDTSNAGSADTYSETSEENTSAENYAETSSDTSGISENMSEEGDSSYNESGDDVYGIPYGEEETYYTE